MCSIRDVYFWKEFFDLYKHYPELWKVKSEAYKNRMLKRRAYAHLLDKYREYEPEATEDSLKRKINNIRGCYRRELKKVNKSYESGCGAEDIYKPNLWYYNDLNFLKDQEENETEDGIASLEIETSFMDSEAQDNSEDQEDPVAVVDNNKTKTVKSYARTRIVTPAHEHSLPRSKRLATEKALEDLKLICKALTQPPEEQNEFDCFGVSIACQLKKLPEKVAQESMDYIQSFLVRQRVKVIENPCFGLTWNKKRMRSEDSDFSSHVDGQDKKLKSDIYQMTKQMKEKEMEFIEAEHIEKVHILNLEKRNLENKLKYEEKEHMLKIQQLNISKTIDLE